MNRKAHYILAATLITTVVCLDRVAMAENGPRAPLRVTARALVGRLSSSFRQVIPAMPVHRAAYSDARTTADARSTGLQLPLHPQSGLPFWFRLPPPRA